MAKYQLFGKIYKLCFLGILIASSVVGCSIVLSLISRGNQTNSSMAKHPGNQALLNHGLSKAVVGLKPETTPELRTFSVPAQFQGKTLFQVKLNNPEKVIALTFDDGPWQKTTLQVLDILKKNNINATFFWVGAALEKNPQIAQQVVADGNAIGNHTWHHWYHHLDEKTAAKEIEDTAQLMYKTTGVKTSLFRPPGGFLKNGVAAYAKQQNYAVVMWSVSSADTDWKAQPSAFVKNVLKGAKPGSIVLMHDGGGDHTKTVKALPEIISGLRQMGYRFVTVPELLKDAKSK